VAHFPGAAVGDPLPETGELGLGRRRLLEHLMQRRQMRLDLAQRPGVALELLAGIRLGVDLRDVVYRVLIARAARTAMTTSEIKDCNIISTLARRERTIVSVGLKAVLVLNARKR
jgi:hypothetical protein